jgi:hypothetical protein
MISSPTSSVSAGSHDALPGSKRMSTSLVELSYIRVARRDKAKPAQSTQRTKNLFILPNTFHQVPHAPQAPGATITYRFGPTVSKRHRLSTVFLSFAAVFWAGFRAWRSHPDGRWLASAGRDRAIRIWRVADQVELNSLQGHEGEGIGRPGRGGRPLYQEGCAPRRRAEATEMLEKTQDKLILLAAVTTVATIGSRYAR